MKHIYILFIFAISLTNAANPPLDCNYVSWGPYSVTHRGSTHHMAVVSGTPIGVCEITVVDVFSPSDAIYDTLQYICDNNEVYVEIWINATTCDESIPADYTVAVDSDDFKCDAAASCDYAMVVEWNLDPADVCVDGVAPSDVPPYTQAFIIDTCFASATQGESVFVSGCDSDGNLTYQFYDGSYCNGTLIDSESFPPAPGLCLEQFIFNDKCVVTTAPMTTVETTLIEPTNDASSEDSDDARDSDSDSGEGVNSNAKSSTHEYDETDFRDGLWDEARYSVKVKFSNETLINLWGLFALLIAVNIFYCFVCKRATNCKKTDVQQLENEHDGSSRLDRMT